MNNKDFNLILLKTAFSVMACDGEIDQREIDVIKAMAKQENYFGDLNIQQELNEMLSELKEKGHKFFQEYFSQLENTNLPKDDELKIIRIAINTINADEKVEYSEIKFFKVIRSILKLSNEEILDQFPEIEEFLEEDILSKSYISKLKSRYFESIDLPTIKSLDIDFGSEG